MQTLGSIEKWVADKKLPRYRAKQIYQAMTKNLISNWEKAIELPKDLQEKLNDEMPISTLKIKKILPDRGGDPLGRPEERVIHRIAPANEPTIKIAFQTYDNLIIESVLMRHLSVSSRQVRNTVCVSTQIGCPMNCAFCATGKMGFTRNLTAEEIVDQVLEFARILDDSPSTHSAIAQGGDQGRTTSSGHENHVNNVVFMGMGEPFLNYENVLSSIKILNDNQGFNLGHRHITISTSGIVPGILKFADEDIQVNLAISLHAPNNEIRDAIMPVNKKYPLEKLLPAVSEYMDKTNRKVFFEYILLDRVNDSDENILELISLLKNSFPDQMHLVHVNLIEYNEIENKNKLGSPDRKTTKHIFDLLQRNNILTTVRYRFGDDINAACGQLAGKS